MSHRAPGPSQRAEQAGLLDFLAGLRWPLVVVAAVVALVLLWSHAGDSEGKDTARQRLFGEVMALRMYSAMDRPPGASTILSPADASVPFTWSVRFHDPSLRCRSSAPPVACGAVLEVYSSRDEAHRRAEQLASGSGVVVRRGSLVLRVTALLPPDRRDSYVQGFDEAVNAITSFSDLADLER